MSNAFPVDDAGNRLPAVRPSGPRLLTTLVQIWLIRTYANLGCHPNPDPGREDRVIDDEVTCHVEGES